MCGTYGKYKSEYFLHFLSSRWTCDYRTAFIDTAPFSRYLDVLFQPISATAVSLTRAANYAGDIIVHMSLFTHSHNPTGRLSDKTGER